MITALGLPAIVGGAALALETGYWYFRDVELQAAADAAAYAAGLEQRSGATFAVIEAAALREARANGLSTTLGSMVLTTPPTTGSQTGNAQAVQVLLSEQQPRFLTQIFSEEPVIARARSVAIYTTASEACVLALSPNSGRAVQFSGNTNSRLVGCSVMTNSIAADAAIVQGSARLTTPCLISVGGAQTTNGMTLTECPAPITEAAPVADPFAGVAAPSTAGNCRNIPNNGPLQPGRYCNGISLNRTATLQPGTYVVSGGDFSVGAQGNVTGAGVTIYLMGNSTVTINGNATVRLTAPSSGTYAGMVFFGARDNTGPRARFNGSASSRITGTIYMPNQAVEYLGNFGGENGCQQIVANTVEMTGSSDFAVNCSAYGMRPIPALQNVRLAE